jgi:hypothetical protein
MELAHDPHIMFNRKMFLILMAILIGTIIIDLSFVRTYDLVDKYIIPLHSKLILFTVNSVLCITTQFVIIRYIKKSVSRVRLESRGIKILYVVPIVSLCTLSIVITILTIQLFGQEYYDTFLSILVVSISHVASASILLWLSYLFLSWYKLIRNFVIFLYFASILLVAVNLLFTGSYVIYKIFERPDRVFEFVGSAGLIYSDKGLFLEIPYRVTSFASFLCLWITTATLLYFYRDRQTNALSYWLVLGAPLVYFLFTYFSRPILSNIFMYYAQNYPVQFTIAIETFIALSRPVGGLVFSLVFWKIAKIVSYERNIKAYMAISGWGIVLIVSSDQGETQSILPYPPFGLVTVTVLVTASFLMLLGIYNSASLVSANNLLRKTIHKHASESRLLDLIGQAETENSIQRAVKLIYSDRNIIEQETKEPVNLDEEELRKYIDLIFKELKKGKPSND